MAAAGRTVGQPEHDVNMEAGPTVIAGGDVTDCAQHLGLFADLDLPVALRGKIEPADRRLLEGPDRGQRCGCEFLVIGEFGQRRERLLAGVEYDDMHLSVRGVGDELALHRWPPSVRPPSCGTTPRRPGTSPHIAPCRRSARNRRRTPRKFQRIPCRCACGAAY